MKKKENYEEHPKYDDFMKNMLLKDIKDFTERNNNYNKKNDIIKKENVNMNNRTLKDNKIKFNNFFKGKSNNDLIDQDNTVEISLTNKERIRLEYAQKIKYKKKKDDSFDESENYPDYIPNNYEVNNSKINNKSIDKFKSYFGNSFNGIELITN